MKSEPRWWCAWEGRWWWWWSWSCDLQAKLVRRSLARSRSGGEEEGRKVAFSSFSSSYRRLCGEVACPFMSAKCVGGEAGRGSTMFGDVEGVWSRYPAGKRERRAGGAGRRGLPCSRPPVECSERGRSQRPAYHGLVSCMSVSSSIFCPELVTVQRVDLTGNG